ncbi:MAG TPA: hypothetical protein VK797_23035 [Tepidisphaeraceae bacterium]|jgi:hypothetical protein|nr:hypothetical protein [Tepidisphaeraceae bacterium]
MITHAFTDQAKQDFQAGLHQPGDQYMIALYTSSANLDKTTTAYTSAGEVVGSGYTAGGMALSGYAAGLSGDSAYLSWNNPVWTMATFTARGALIYNATRSNNAIAVINFGSDFAVSAANFTVQLPPAGASAMVVIN